MDVLIGIVIMTFMPWVMCKILRPMFNEQARREEDARRLDAYFEKEGRL